MCDDYFDDGYDDGGQVPPSYYDFGSQYSWKGCIPPFVIALLILIGLIIYAASEGAFK